MNSANSCVSHTVHPIGIVLGAGPVSIVWLAAGGRCDTRATLLRSEHHYTRAYLHPTVEINHILIGQPDAARRDGMSDPCWLVRAVDAIKRVFTACVEVERARTHRIVRTAFDIVWQ